MYPPPVAGEMLPDLTRAMQLEESKVSAARASVPSLPSSLPSSVCVAGL